jgi:hypothetical protein
MKITSCSLQEQQSLLGPGHTDVHVIYEDGSKQKLFSFYSDEIQFTEAEVVGLTREEALELFHRRDTDYLRS